MQLRLNPVLSTDAGDYTVEITESGSGQSVRASTELVVADSAPSSPVAAPAAAPSAQDLSAGSAGAVASSSGGAVLSMASAGNTSFGGSPSATDRQWWVYAAESIDPENASGSPSRRGFWVMEYVPQVDPVSGKVTGVGAGRSAWIWQGSGAPEQWAAADVRASVPVAVGDAWVLCGVRSGPVSAVLQLSGAVVNGSDSAWYGAPESLSGTLGSSGTSVRLKWDADASSQARWIPESGWADLLEQLRLRASTSGAAVGSGD
jgi:hypothetical protein